MSRARSIFPKIIIGWMAAMLLLSPLAARQVFAQGLPVIDSTLVGFKTKNEIETQIQKPLSVALIQILLNLISFVANRLAYDAAVAIASAGPGQTPQYEYRSIEDYGQDLWEDILGETIGELSEGLDIIGIKYNVCAPTSPFKRLDLQLGIAASVQRPEPTCNFREIQSNWEGFVASIENDVNGSDRLFKEFAASFGEGQSELSSTIIILSTTFNQAAHTQTIKTDELLANDRFKDVSNFITGNVQTPSTVLEDQFKLKLDEAQGNQTKALQGALFSNEGALLQIGISAGSVFLNTLLSQLTNKIYTGLFEPPTSGGVFDPNFINTSGREQARQTFKGLLTAPIQTVDQYNVVNQFLSCPGAANRGPNNCTMDTSFAAALSRAEAGDALTVQEAIDAGLLHGDWPLISSNDPARNQDAFCYTYGYCTSNLTKMRIARVVPVGWELAAEKSGQGNIPVTTLQDAVDSFSDCNLDNPDALLDANHPWCHLVDPNWVLKYPETQCRAQVYGQTLVAPNADVRNQTCVDTPSCIEEDENGNCVGGYGYCTRERNVWRFNGDACPAQYASCTTLTSRTGEVASYLTTTVDFDGCNADNAGCRWYREAQTFDAGDPADPEDDTFVWENILPSSVTANISSVRDYFDAGAAVCPSGDAGCTGLVRAAAATFNPVINASFENDVDEDDVPDAWMVTSVGIPEITTDPEAVAFGSTAVVMENSERLATKNKISLPPNQFVTLSITARKETGASNTMHLTWAFFYDILGTQLTATTVPPAPTPTVNSPNCSGDPSGLISFGDPLDEVFTRYSCTFTTPNVPTWMDISIGAAGRSPL